PDPPRGRAPGASWAGRPAVRRAPVRYNTTSSPPYLPPSARPRGPAVSTLTRRDFLQGSLAAAATVTIAGTKSSARVLGASDTIRVAVAGLNGRGGAHVKAFAGMKGVQVVCLIDPDTRTFAGRVKQVEKVGGNTPRTV